MIEQLTLDAGATRATDPSTSQRAASAQRGGVPPKIVEALAYLGVATDDEIARALPQFLSSTVKTARSRLTNAGVIEWTGEERPGLVTGSAQREWRLARRQIETVHDAERRIA